MRERRLATVSRAGAGSEDPTWARLEDQLDWYDRKSFTAQRAYMRWKVVELVVAAAVPVLAGLRAPAAATAGLAAVVVVLEGVQHLFQWQTNWVLYRSTAEGLKHERYLYLAQAGPYAGEGRHRMLAERIEGLISQEHAKWTEGHGKADSESPLHGETTTAADGDPPPPR